MKNNALGICFLFTQNSETTQASQYSQNRIFGREELSLV